MAARAVQEAGPEDGDGFEVAARRKAGGPLPSQVCFSKKGDEMRVTHELFRHLANSGIPPEEVGLSAAAWISGIGLCMGHPQYARWLYQQIMSENGQEAEQGSLIDKLPELLPAELEPAET